MILLQPRASEYDECLEFIKEKGLGFELISFMFAPVLDDSKTKKELLRKFSGAPVKVLHGPFADLNFSGGDPEIYKVTEKRITQCCECAKALDVHKMVLHSCFFPVMPKNDPLYPLWSEQSAYLMENLSDKYNITFCVENLLDINPDIQVMIMKAAKGHKGIRATLDAGHANLTRTPQNIWNTNLSPWLSHFHLSDNGGVYDDHIAVGTGTVDWDLFFASLNPQGGDIDFTIEVNGLDAVKKSVEYLEKTNRFEKLKEY